MGVPVARVPTRYSVSVIKTSHRYAIQTTASTFGELSMVTFQGQRVLTGKRYERKVLPRHAVKRIPTIGRYTTVEVPARPDVTAKQTLCHSGIRTHVTRHLSTFLLFP